MNKANTLLVKDKGKVYEDFFKERYTHLYYFALHFVPDTEVAKDIVSEAFRSLWEKIDTINYETMMSYMLTCVRNLCIDHIRHEETKYIYINSYDRLTSELDAEDWSEMDRRCSDVMHELDLLPAKTRFIMEQNYLYKKKYKEIAEMTGLTESGVRKQIMKGLDIIRSKFSVKYKKGR